jgi:serine/threonine-protein phosphatase 5
MNKIYGFEGEVRSKLNETFVELFAEVFCCLPLAHVINEKVFIVHGGLFSVDGVKLSEIRSINRFCEPPEEGKIHYYIFFLLFIIILNLSLFMYLCLACVGLMCELLWSDPQPLPGRGPSKRGVGLSFGGDVTKRFLKDNNLGVFFIVLSLLLTFLFHR